MARAPSTIEVTETRDIERFRQTLSGGRVAAHGYLVLLGLRPCDTPALLRRLREGLTFEAFEHLARNTALPREALIALVQITARTLSRRKDEGRFRPAESDRLVRATRVFAHAITLFEGDADLARKWFVEPLAALGGASPLAYASTDLGAREVEDLIGRLEHGIPS